MCQVCYATFITSGMPVIREQSRLLPTSRLIGTNLGKHSRVADHCPELMLEIPGAFHVISPCIGRHSPYANRDKWG
jgi:hypothetical protein